jgi:hypothetical protein
MLFLPLERTRLAGLCFEQSGRARSIYALWALWELSKVRGLGLSATPCIARKPLPRTCTRRNPNKKKHKRRDSLVFMGASHLKEHFRVRVLGHLVAAAATASPADSEVRAGVERGEAEQKDDVAEAVGQLAPVRNLTRRHPIWKQARKTV